MYVADADGVWLIRTTGSEPGPTVVETSPSVPAGSVLTGAVVGSLRLIFSEPVLFQEADVHITDAAGAPVVFSASGSGSQFMLIALAEPLASDDHTVTLADTITSAATGLPLDGDSDGVAGGDASITFTHRCAADISGDRSINVNDFFAFLSAYQAGCP